MSTSKHNYIVKQVANIREEDLASFRRYQKVERVWREEKGNWVEKTCVFEEDWTSQEIAIITNRLRAIDAGGGRVTMVRADDRIVGFAATVSKELGPKGEFRQLYYCHVSRDHRGKGVGTMLLEDALERLDPEAEGLYISAHSSVESTGFYLKHGCLDAPWRSPEQVALEPYDRQLVLYREMYQPPHYSRLQSSDVGKMDVIDASQTIGRAWREIDGVRQLVRIDYEDPTWPNGEEAHRMGFVDAVSKGGVAIGALDREGIMKGFGTIKGELYGEHNRYALLDQLFISRESRGMGIGRRLFDYLAEAAKELGADHLYICAGSAEETIAFYRALGCREAVEVIRELAEADPRDLQLVYSLKRGPRGGDEHENR